MIQILKKVIYFCIIICMTSVMYLSLGSTNVYASNLELLGNNKGLNVSPENTNLFDISNMNPGQTVSSKITIKNDYAQAFELFLKAERIGEEPLQGEPDLYKQIQLEVTFRGKVIFNGAMIDFANSGNSISLGTFSQGEVQEIVANAYLPGAETGNEFQGKNLKTKWTFIATSTEPASSESPETRSVIGTSVLPKTGSVIETYLFSILGVALIGAGIFGIYKYRKE